MFLLNRKYHSNIQWNLQDKGMHDYLFKKEKKN